MSELSIAFGMLSEGYRLLSIHYKNEEAVNDIEKVEKQEEKSVKEEIGGGDANTEVSNKEDNEEVEVSEEKEDARKEVGSGVLNKGEEEAGAVKEGSDKEGVEFKVSELEDEEFEPINVWKLKRERKKQQEQEKSNVEMRKEKELVIPSYNPLLARRTNTGDYGVIFDGQLYVLSKDSYQVMRTSVNQQKRFCELKAIHCYRCHENHSSTKPDCQPHFIPTCRGCGRLIRNLKECPTPLFRYFKEHGRFPSAFLPCPYHT